MKDTIILLLKSMIILVMFFLIASFCKKTINELGKTRSTNTPKNLTYKTYDRINIVYSQIAYISFYFIIFVGLMIVLPSYGIQKETIYGLMLSVAFAIGLSAQGVLSNIWCGLIMILGEVYDVDDVVSLDIANPNSGTVIGRIISINLFYTKLSDIKDGTEIMISNSLIYNEAVSYNQTKVYQE
jgi:small-conductance mechanosensitive channel